MARVGMRRESRAISVVVINCQCRFGFTEQHMQNKAVSRVRNATYATYTMVSTPHHHSFVEQFFTVLKPWIYVAANSDTSRMLQPTCVQALRHTYDFCSSRVSSISSS